MLGSSWASLNEGCVSEVEGFAFVCAKQACIHQWVEIVSYCGVSGACIVHFVRQRLIICCVVYVCWAHGLLLVCHDACTCQLQVALRLRMLWCLHSIRHVS
jgi:hypothetical protein